MTAHRLPVDRPSFDSATAHFDDLGPHLWEPIGAATVAALDLRPGERVLDACCGTGASALPTARLVGADGLVDAVDVSVPMVDQLRRHAADLPQLRATSADVTTWEPSGYDVVQAVLGIFFFPDMAAGTDHLVSRARVGGRVGLTIWRRGAMEAAGVRLGRAVSEVLGTPPAGPPAAAPPERDVRTVDGFTGWLRERDLHDVVVRVHEHRLPMTPEIAWLVVLGSGFRAALDPLDEEGVEAVRNRYLHLLAEDDVTELDATTLVGTGSRR
ncbi:class I SAM-dependent methyltransferase [Actinoalloteichus spitiensis]|uniref:class I SAM-dependent methyltransferase n=1 Tax=Actinoalloteichus spitiensis TaxID=252394 RepID=UPI00058509A7|nr:methyltransferase domain-containing protein [Actinoalloteichus spitiensis]